MEKYSRHKDVATSINPFVPPAESVCFPTRLTTVAWVARLVPAAVRFMLFFLCVCLIEVVIAFDEGCVPLHLHYVTRPLLYRPLMMLLTRVALWLGASTAVATHFFPNARAASGNRDDVSAPWPPQPGDAIICNLQSPLDVLVLLGLSTSQPLTFVFPNDDGSAAGTQSQLRSFRSVVRAMNFVCRIADCRGKRKSNGAASAESGYDLSFRQRACRDRAATAMVFFPEETTTNGRGMLRFCLFRVDPSPSVPSSQYSRTAGSNELPLVAALSYSLSSTGGESGCYCAVIPPTGSQCWSVLWNGILRCSLNVARCRVRADVAVVRPSHLGVSLDPLPTQAFSPSFIDGLRQKMAAAAAHWRVVAYPCHPLQLSAATNKAEFLDQWDQYQ